MEVDLLNFDDALNSYFGLGTGSAAGGLLATLIVMALFLFPFLYFCRKFNMSSMIVSIVIAFTSLCFGVVVQWVSYWVLLVVVLIAALMFAGSMRDWITGTNRG